MKNLLWPTFFAGLLTVSMSLGAPVVLSAAEADERPNVLFIAVDDLRPELGCYGATQMITPNLDQLASRGVLFKRAYCQVAVCGASRASLLSGCRPETTNCWDYKTPLRKMMPDVVTLPQTFKEAGYETTFIGKVYHSPSDDRESWNVSADRIVPADRNKSGLYVTEANRGGDRKRAADGTRATDSTENGGDVPDDAYKDGHNAVRAIKMLEHLRQSDDPFFFALGFSRPHLPFAVPDRYWQMYDRETIKIPARDDVVDSVPYGRSGWGELKNYADIPRNVSVLDDAKTRELIHGYYASTSYVDAQIGKVLAALDELGLADNTIVVLWGDHGWYLGDYGDWCKHTNYEVATRVPLMISVPEKLGGHRGVSDSLVELVDLYPTLCEISKIAVPAHCQGTSLQPVLEEPNRPWKDAAFSQYKKNKPGLGRMLGTSIRTDRFRYTEWRSYETGELDAVELIDFKTDPGATRNVAGEKAYRDELPRLAELAGQSATGLSP